MVKLCLKESSTYFGEKIFLFFWSEEREYPGFLGVCPYGTIRYFTDEDLVVIEPFKRRVERGLLSSYKEGTESLGFLLVRSSRLDT